jgi:phosphoenolpyruvate carboxykinase (GTP)
MWPGYGENSRIIKWMIDRIEGKTGVRESEIGLFPQDGAIDLDGLDIKKETMDKLLRVDKEDWKKEVVMIEEFYNKFGDKIPKDLRDYLKELKAKLGV